MRNWFSFLFAWKIAVDVPDELDRCLSCRKQRCTEGDFATCSRRLARAAELHAVGERDPDPASGGVHPTFLGTSQQLRAWPVRRAPGLPAAFDAACR